MNDAHISIISTELALRPNQVRATASLLDEGGTVPFIARYRKEATGSLDEVAITAIRDRLAQLAEPRRRLDERPELTLSPELDLALWAPLDTLVPVARRVAELRDRDVSAYAIELPEGGELIVWGITYMILERLRALAEG